MEVHRSFQSDQYMISEPALFAPPDVGARRERRIPHHKVCSHCSGVPRTMPLWVQRELLDLLKSTVSTIGVHDQESR